MKSLRVLLKGPGNAATSWTLQPERLCFASTDAAAPGWRLSRRGFAVRSNKNEWDICLHYVYMVRDVINWIKLFQDCMVPRCFNQLAEAILTVQKGWEFVWQTSLVGAQTPEAQGSKPNMGNSSDQAHRLSHTPESMLHIRQKNCMGNVCESVSTPNLRYTGTYRFRLLVYTKIFDIYEII